MFSIADQLKSLQAVLGKWATDNNGQAFVASDPQHLWEIAYSASSQLRVIICYMGESNRGPFETGAILLRVDREFMVLITRGRGFTYPRGNALTDGTAGPPMFQLVEEGRDLIRSIFGISVERPLDFKSVKHHSMGEVIMDAYAIEFSVADDLPRIADTPAPALMVTPP